jgi:thioester reductase-like protein
MRLALTGATGFIGHQAMSALCHKRRRPLDLSDVCFWVRRAFDVAKGQRMWLRGNAHEFSFFLAPNNLT